MAGDLRFKVETSARHCHLTQDTLEALFGKGFDLDAHKRHPLSQPGQYASTIRVDILTIGADGHSHRINGVSILGPARKYNQIEISLTDSHTLGVEAPLRVSGDVKGSVPVTIVSVDRNLLDNRELARVNLTEGLVVQKRHIHCNPVQAAALGVEDWAIVKVDVASPTARHIVFDDVVVRGNTAFDLAMHLGTD